MYGIFTYIYHRFKPNVGKYIPYMAPYGLSKKITNSSKNKSLSDASVWRIGQFNVCFQYIRGGDPWITEAPTANNYTGVVFIVDLERIKKVSPEMRRLRIRLVTVHVATIYLFHVKCRLCITISCSFATRIRNNFNTWTQVFSKTGSQNGWIIHTNIWFSYTKLDMVTNLG